MAVPSHAITARSDGDAHAEDEAAAMADDSDSDTDGPVSEVEARRATACEAYARSVLSLLEESRCPPTAAGGSAAAGSDCRAP